LILVFKHVDSYVIFKLKKDNEKVFVFFKIGKNKSGTIKEDIEQKIKQI
jgi:hypothetical protein